MISNKTKGEVGNVTVLIKQPAPAPVKPKPGDTTPVKSGKET